MKTAAKILGISLLIAAMSAAVYAKDEEDKSDAVKRADASANVLDEIMGTPDKGIPTEILESAKCVAVVPSMVKAGFVVGGRHGRGMATCRTANGWSAPAPFTITGGSWGLQIGGEAVDLVMLIMNDKGMQHLLDSKFKVGADASAAAGPVGRHAAADTDWKMRAEVLSYSRSRGIFGGLELNGAVIKQDDDSTRILYGNQVPFARILKGGVAAPEGTHRFVATVAKYASEAKQGAVETPKSGTVASKQQ